MNRHDECVPLLYYTLLNHCHMNVSNGWKRYEQMLLAKEKRTIFRGKIDFSNFGCIFEHSVSDEMSAHLQNYDRPNAEKAKKNHLLENIGSPMRIQLFRAFRRAFIDQIFTMERDNIYSRIRMKSDFSVQLKAYS